MTCAEMRASRILLGIVLLGLTAVGLGCGGGGNGAPSATATVTPTATPVPTTVAGAGLQSEITAASADTTGKVSAIFTLTDGGGVPLTATLSAAQSSQQARVRLTIAQLEQYAGGGELGNTFFRYINQINNTAPAYDSKGTLVLLDAASGTWQYTFGTMLPAGYDRSQTYTVGMQVDRTFAGQQVGVNPVFDFVPGGGAPTVWEDTTTAQCNQCHQPLIAHGNRREVRLCKLCHAESATDPKGQSIDFRHMIHKIHAGKELPSVVAGPPGSFYGIYSGFSMSYAIFSEKLDDGSVIGVGFPRNLEECLPCHSEGPTAAFHAEKPSTPACATCHDDVNPSLQTTAAGPPGTKHSPGGYADGQCSGCHAATQDKEFDISVPGAHVVPERSAQLQGLNVSITNVANHAAGQAPVISFMVTNNAGTPLRDLNGLSSLTFNYAGPTTDYTDVISAAAKGSSGLTGPDDAGVFQLATATPIPADATGTWSLGAEARRTVQLTSSVSATEAAPNPVVTFTVDDSMPLARRVEVANENCRRCHGEFSKDFSIHGGSRNNTQYCVFCHNPSASDAERRDRDPAAVAAGENNATINFRVMIHKIHRGEALEQQPYLVYGFGSGMPGYTIHDFGEVRFPGDLRLCATCHVDDSQLIPPYPNTALPTLRTKLDPANGNEIPADPPAVQPITSVCTACHDADAAMAHAATNTTAAGVEACPVCHAEGAAFAVSNVHAVGGSD